MRRRYLGVLNGGVRIGTWNLDARWTSAHYDALVAADCDVWLLTEVRPDVVLPGFTAVVSTGRMTRRQHYAAVFSRLGGRAFDGPHPASAAVLIDDVTYCSCVLPWAAPDDPAVWGTGSQGERTSAAVARLVANLPANRTVWGGDFNHALAGPTRWSGSAAGRSALLDALPLLGVAAPTAELPHRNDAIRSIDHVCIPAAWTVTSASRVAQPGLSDHDMYVVVALSETVRPSS